MLVARLTCSDPSCLAELDAIAPTLAELETLACDCGCGLEVVRVAEGPDEPSGGFVVLAA